MRNDPRVSSLLVATLALLMALSQAQAQCDLIAIAEKEIVEKFPSYDLKEFRRVVSESGSLWELTYELPINMLGGVPIVTIDKKTCKVVRIIHTQ